MPSTLKFMPEAMRMLIWYSMGVPLPMTVGYIAATSRKVRMVMAMAVAFLVFSDFFPARYTARDPASGRRMAHTGSVDATTLASAMDDILPHILANYPSLWVQDLFRLKSGSV